MPSAPRRLVIFDVAGTLVDSQDSIVASLTAAYEAEGVHLPSRAELLSVVGLSLPLAFATLLPDEPEDRIARMVEGYKASYLEFRRQSQDEAGAPMFPGARDALDDLRARGYVLGVATGKARRGVDHFISGNGLEGAFTAIQTADDAPSKPHPQMVLNCLAVTDIAPADAVIVGDTEFDMAMGRTAGVRRIGVDWGYHPPERVRRGGAEAMAADFGHLGRLIEEIW